MLTGRAVTSQEVTALSSPYLDEGYRRDVLSLDYAEIGDGFISGGFSVPDHFTPADGVFHFTLLLAFVAVARLAVIYAHVDNGLSTKRSEVLVRQFDLACKQLITDPSGIVVSLTLVSRRQLAGALDYQGRIDICDGRFVGEGSFYFPLPQSA